MENQSFQELKLIRIGRCPWQARKAFDIEDLIPSIKSKGVLEPILVRPLEDPALECNKGFPTEGRMVDHQLVAGERRFRALWAVAMENGGVEAARIPAMVRVLSDDDAFDIATIENLHRKDLNELEEAEGFKTYIERHGSGSIESLADRIGVSSRYIRRRIRLLSLPVEVLEAWGKGEIQYGYLEQFVRLRDPEKIMEFFKDIIDGDSWNFLTVKDLKQHIDDESPVLKSALFDTKREGCRQCPQSSEVQKWDLGIEQEGKQPRCLDPACFKTKQSAYLTAHWKDTNHHKQNKTNEYRFDEDLPYGQFEQWYGGKSPAKKCFECKSFVTRLNLDGTASNGRVCVGDKGCFRGTQNKNVEPGGKPGKRDPASPTAAWHGDLYRDEFYKSAIREKLAVKAPFKLDVLNRVILAALLKSNELCQSLFLKEFGGKKTGYIRDDKVWEIIQQLDLVQVDQALAVCSREVVLDGSYTYGYCDARPRVAAFLGIDIARDYRLTKEYLEKKTIAEIQALAKEHKLWERKEAKTFLYETLLKKRGQFSTCKKPELIRIIIESGMDLAGVVPKEILGKGAK